MKFITWNVNGLRACMEKGFINFIQEQNPDFICLQETKMQLGQAAVDLPGYYQFWNSALKKGYSGTAIFTRIKPIAVSFDLENQFTNIKELDLKIYGAETFRKETERAEDGHNNEGRLITLEYGKFYLVTEYTPNAKDKLARINYRLEWEEARRNYLKKLDSNKPVILCGDLNVAHNEIDLKNPKANRGNAGFSDQERAAFSELIEEGFVDSYRYLYPDVEGKYTWWSYRFNARDNNAGWRIDYFIVSDRVKNNIKEITQRDDIFGSDHCPVILDYIENDN